MMDYALEAEVRRRGRSPVGRAGYRRPSVRARFRGRRPYAGRPLRQRPHARRSFKTGRPFPRPRRRRWRPPWWWRNRWRFPRPGPPVVVIDQPAVEPSPPEQGTEYIRWVQSTLNQVQGRQLPVNGIAGSETRDAIREFQSSRGLPVTGIVGPQTERALISALLGRRRPSGAARARPSSEIEVVDLEWQSEVNRRSRAYIRWVQQGLNRVLGLRLAQDGILGPKTRSAIRDFQRGRGLSVDGKVGSQTERALIAAGAGSPPVVKYGTAQPSGRPGPGVANLPGVNSRCERSPASWAKSKRRKMLRWWNDDNRDDRGRRLSVGANLREMTPKVFPGVPAEAIVGFCANGNIRENTTENPRTRVRFHEIGLFGTEAGLRNGPAPNPNPKAKYNRWGKLAYDPRVRQLLGGRAATMKHNAWKTAIPDQVAVGLVNVFDHGRNVARHLDPGIRPNMSGRLSLFFVACCFMGWSAGDGRAIKHLNRFSSALASVPEERRWGAFLRAVADGIRSGQLNLHGLRKHQSVAYSAQRTLQKLAAGQLLAAEVGGPASWFDPGLGVDQDRIVETITCAGNKARRRRVRR